MRRTLSPRPLPVGSWAGAATLLWVACADPVVPSPSAPDSESGEAEATTAVASSGSPDHGGTDEPARLPTDGNGDGSSDSDGDSASSTGDDPPESPGFAKDPGPPFAEVAEPSGVLVPHEKALGQWGMGIAWRDYDADGHEDLFVTGGALPSRLLRNEGDGTFTEVQSEVIAALVDTAGASWADVDDDGWPELLVVGRDRGWLLHNERGQLVDITAESGTGLETRSFGQSSAWADVDGNGHLDLFVAHSGYQGSQLHLGNGDGTFVEASGSLDITVLYYPLAVGFFDYDEDGDPDLYVVHDRRDGNHLWRNDGPGCGGWCMTEVASELGVDTQVEGMGLAIGDPDEDGDFDLFFTDAEHAVYLRNDGPAGFIDDTLEAGLIADTFGWGALFFDYDADGYLDLYEAVQLPNEGRNRLYRGHGNGTFEDRSLGSGMEALGQSMTVAYADYDGDGAPDVVVGNENEDYRLYRNQRADLGWRWLNLELRGSGQVARDAVGTRVVVETASGRHMLRQVEIGSGFGSSNTPRVHFGITTDPPVDVEVTWPDGVVTHPWPPVEDAVWIIEHP